MKISEAGLPLTGGPLGENWLEAFGAVEAPPPVTDLAMQAYYTAAFVIYDELMQAADAEGASLATVLMKLGQLHAEAARWHELRDAMSGHEEGHPTAQ